ncbi:MAG: PaaI family thioesterase [Xanthobacteraceae bacterium]|nr:PaaI family thioesterase [Xanthobacteraceae bacterium]
MKPIVPPPALTVTELEAYLRAEFPQVFNADSGVSIEDAWHGGARVRQAWRETFIRPGGTVSGPTMMALADFAMYVAVLAAIGPVGLAVTTSLNINFLRKPGRADLLAEAKLMKLGKRLAVGEVALTMVGSADVVAHVTATYSIPIRGT